MDKPATVKRESHVNCGCGFHVNSSTQGNKELDAEACAHEHAKLSGHTCEVSTVYRVVTS